MLQEQSNHNFDDTTLTMLQQQYQDAVIGEKHEQIHIPIGCLI